FEIHLKLHNSQTYIVEDDKELQFEIHLKLHNSQTSDMA
ncbi:hypothetical protein HMPREF9730_01323, partial [Treponema denticola AL-2]